MRRKFLVSFYKVKMDTIKIQRPHHHREIIEKFVTACQADDRILAAFLGGSYAAGKADRYSDLDLYFIVTDEAYEPFISEREKFVHVLGEPLFLEDFGVRHGYLIIFANGAEAEFWFGRESHFTHIHEGPYEILLDKKGLLSDVVFPPYTADLDEQTEVLKKQLAWFWHELSHFLKAMGRKQLWFAYGQIEVMRKICVNLARLHYNFADAYLGDGGEPYFKVEQILPVEQLAPLKSTYCVMEYAPILQAARVLCHFYQDVAPALAKAHHLTYQSELERLMFAQLEALDAIN